MVAGKLSILLSGSIAYADTVDNPRFYSYSGGYFINRLVDVSFGWFRKLDQDQLVEYNQAISHAVMYAENGKPVSWYKNDASGFAVPVYTWPNGNGYCRRIHIKTVAYNREKSYASTACFNNVDDNWRWISDK